MALSTSVALEFLARDKSKRGFASVNRSLGSLSGTMLRMAGIGGGLYMLTRSIKWMTSAFLEQEKAELVLQAALRNTGSLTASNMREFQEYAAQLQKATKYGDELILSQMAYAHNLGVTEDRLKDAAKYLYSSLQLSRHR